MAAHVYLPALSGGSANDRYANRLFKVRPDGGGQQAICPVQPWRPALFGFVQELSWRSDGTRLLVAMTARGVWHLALLSPSTGKFSVPFDGLDLTWGTWSPSGSRIAAGAAKLWPGAPSAPYRLLVMDPSGTSRTLLAQTAGAGFLDAATWSPDSAWIACAVSDDDGSHELRIVSVNTKKVLTIAEGVREPAWCPRL